MVEFKVETKEQMLELTRNFRDQFKDVIKKLEVIPLFHDYKYGFFLRDLLKLETYSQKVTKALNRNY